MDLKGWFLEERIWRRILSRCLAAPTTTTCFPFLWLKGEARETITEYLEQIAGA